MARLLNCIGWLPLAANTGHLTHPLLMRRHAAPQGADVLSSAGATIDVLGERLGAHLGHPLWADTRCPLARVANPDRRDPTRASLLVGNILGQRWSVQPIDG